MWRAVVIEDELNSRELLISLLKRYCPNVEVVGEADGVQSGVEIIQALNPDLIFLDVEMHGGTGFDILDLFEERSFKVIFVTGYEKYALKAIKYSALDYLMKPIKIEELKKIVKKLDLSKETSTPKDNIRLLKEHLSKPKEDNYKIALNAHHGQDIVPVVEIEYLESEDSYVVFHTTTKRYMMSQSLNYFEDFLPKDVFFRTHKSYLVNVHNVQSIEKGRGGAVILKSGRAVPIAIRRRPSFMKFIK